MVDYKYIVCDNYGTGEGRTISIMITRAYTDPVEEFKQAFDGWTALGANYLTKEDFIKNYGQFLPEPALKMINAEGNAIPGNFHFTQQFHFNYA